MRRGRSLGVAALAALALVVVLVLAGSDGPPLGGTPLASPARTWFAPCPRLDGSYRLVDPVWSGPYAQQPWDQLTIRSDGTWAIRFTWSRSNESYSDADLGADPAQLAHYRWSASQDELADDDFLEALAMARGLPARSKTLVIQRKRVRCEHGWLAAPHQPGMPDWPSGMNHDAQFTIDRHGALVADFPVHVANHPYFTPSTLWCGRACRDYLGDGHDVHDWRFAPRTLADRHVPQGLESPYDDGRDLLGAAPAAGDVVRARWRDRLGSLQESGATLAQVRVDGPHVELTFAAHDSAGLVAAPAAMRHVSGVRNVVVHRFSGTSASPQTLTLTADVDAALR